MRVVTATGALPASLAENSRPGDWVGTLALAGDLAGLTGIEAIGPHGLYFSVRWDAALSLAFVTPGAAADFEGFGGAVPRLGFSLRLGYGDGTVLDLPTQYQVTVLDRNDTAPTALRFATGGAVTAGAIGATIGTLAVTDPDSAGPFYYSFAEEDAWRFEMVGNTLKLRDGISLGLDEAPSHPLFIEVSDGRQSAAFTLDLTIRIPEEQQTVLPLLQPGETQSGFSLDGDTQAMALREARQVVVDNAYGGGVRQLVLEAGTEVWLPAVDRLLLADGYVEFTADGVLARAAALQAAMLGAGAGGATLAQQAARAEAGTGWAEIAAAMAPEPGAILTDADYVGLLFQDMLDRAPTEAELALHAGRLASGLSRAQLAVDVAMSPASLALQAAENEAGHWAFQPPGSGAAWRSDPGGLGTGGSPPGQAAEGVWVM
jgi:hypothetical protein